MSDMKNALIEAAKLSCEHDWQTSYLIPRCAKCGFTEDGFRYFNQGVAHGFDAALSLLQWKDVADGLPEVEGTYVVIGEYSLSPYLLQFPYELSNKWEKTVAAYIPVPIPEYVKEQR